MKYELMHGWGIYEINLIAQGVYEMWTHVRKGYMKYTWLHKGYMKCELMHRRGIWNTHDYTTVIWIFYAFIHCGDLVPGILRKLLFRKLYNLTVLRIIPGTEHNIHKVISKLNPLSDFRLSLAFPEVCVSVLKDELVHKVIGLKKL